LIDEDGGQLGILPIKEAIEMAKGKGLDVVEVSPNTEPPVCKILDYGKYLFEQKKKTQGAKKKQKTIQVKEIKFRPLIEKGDYEVKVNKIRDFIEQGNKVKISLRYRGREMRHVELGHDLLKRVLTDIEGISSVEQEVQFEGRQLITVVAPKHN
jgi:translation initiation factor IF-3